MRRTLAVTFLLAGLATFGCAQVGKLAASAIEKPHLAFKAVRVEEVDLGGATLAFDLSIENPNGFGLTVDRATYGIEAEGTPVATGELPGGLSLPAKGKAPLTITARVRFEDVSEIAKLVESRDAIHYRLSGAVGVKTALGTLELPFSHEGLPTIPHLPGFSLEGIAIRHLSFDRAEVEVRVRIANRNAFPLPEGRLDAAISLAGAEVARVDDHQLAAVPAGGNVLSSIPIDLDLAEAGRAVADLARGGQVEVEVHGTAEIAGVKLPIELRAKLPPR
jgi:LEA14-like dessication related protein